MNVHEALGPDTGVGFGLPEELQKPQDECGVVGVWRPDAPAAEMAYDALYVLQHRGQNGAGVGVVDAEGQMLVTKGVGLVHEAVPRDEVQLLDNYAGSRFAIGHVRYSTTPDNSPAASQPFPGKRVNFAHNGHLVGMEGVARMFGVDVSSRLTDSDCLAAVVDAETERSGDLVLALKTVLPHVKGAFCISSTDGRQLVGARDKRGYHPLSVGQLPDGGYMLASETVALDDAGITPDKQYHVREGEMVVINEEGIRFEWLEDEEPSEAPQHCMVEYGYLMKKKSRIEGAEIEAIREEMGRQLARTAPVEADIVIDVPNSGTPAARGFSEESGIPLVQALELNDDRRTFIEGEELRKILLADKFLLNPDLVRGLRVVMVDDSVIRGSTTIELNRMLRAAGAREVHVRSALPPNRYPCYMGLDTGNAETLIARDDRADNEIAHELEVDSMGYTTPEDIDAAINAVVEARFRRIGRVCRSCVTGKYPFPVPEAENGVKQPALLGLPGVRRPGDRLLTVS